MAHAIAKIQDHHRLIVTARIKPSRPVDDKNESGSCGNSGRVKWA